MTRWVFILASAGAVAAGPAAFAADSDVVFRSDVSLIRVDAQVVDRDNRAVTGLTAEDFALFEEGRPQQIRNFAAEDVPLDVLFLIDVSASMRPHVERIATAAHQALRQLRPQDRAAIMVFDRATRVRLKFRNSRDDVEREFERLLDRETFNGGTDITRGLLDASAYVEREGRADARRAIVILTDDQTERNRDEAGVSRALARADAVLSALIAPDAMGGRTHGGGGGRRHPGGTWPQGPASDPLGGIIFGRRGTYGGRPGQTQSAGTSEIARASGGDSMPVDDAYALDSTLQRLRLRYTMNFYLPADVRPGQERNIEVRLAGAARNRFPGADVRYRRIYYSPAGSRQGSEPTEISRTPTTSGNPAPPQGGWRQTDEPADGAQPAQGGWRKLKPGEQP